MYDGWLSVRSKIRQKKKLKKEVNKNNAFLVLVGAHFAHIANNTDIDLPKLRKSVRLSFNVKWTHDPVH